MLAASPRRLSRDEPPPRRPRYLLAKKCLNDFFQSPIRMPLLSVIMELRKSRIIPVIRSPLTKKKSFDLYENVAAKKTFHINEIN